MSMHLLATFWVVSFLLIITPGMDWAYMIGAGIRGKGVVPAATGLVSGHLVATLLVAAGIGALVASQPGAMTTLTLAGAAYLLWLGANMLLKPPVPQGAQADGRYSWLGCLLKGAGISGLNPKVLLLFVALLPQFTDPTGSLSITTQILLMGLVHLIGCAVVYLLVGFASQRVLKARPAAARWVGRLSGLAMLAIAAGLLLERLTAS
ncbi:LysE family translocator [Pseudomonas sp. 21LCFQ02]|uniref:LysE family translocator n=1 Tax=Pseudomonas sp. 21LCFQ02 TaxID=2957505 RepID=UPI00209B36D5|nr:LysE family translocator [Pseudomonas sp. 21LCFQ02]MCO8170370.1 LysE family translocator [Pseudomonas sp. 21LCFQ02]